MIKKLLSTILLSCFILLKPSAQNILPIGEWRTHLPYRIGHYVTQSSDRIFYSTGLSILTLDKEEMSTDFITRVDGLSNTTIRMIKYHPANDILVVVYDNSVIDLVKPEGIITMNQIRNFDNITGEKSVNDVYVAGGNFVYLASSYGVSKVNIVDEEFTFTTFFNGSSVRGITVFDGYIYAATDDGIYRTLENNAFPEDFRNWEQLDVSDGFPAEYSSNAIASFKEELYVDINDTLYVYDNAFLNQIHTESNQYSLQYLSPGENNLIVGYRCVSSACNVGKALYFLPDGNYGTFTSGCFGVPNYAIEDEQGRFWFADEWRFFRMLNNPSETACNYLSFDSPYSELSWDIEVWNNQVWLASGALNQTRGPRFREDGVSSFIDGSWTIFNRQTKGAFKGENPNENGDDIVDLITLEVHPENGHVFAGSFLEGMIELDVEGNIQVYNDQNSTLQRAAGDEGRIRIAGLAFDEENNLWVSNHSAINGKPVSVLKPDGTWQSFDRVCGTSDLFEVVVDGSGYKWFLVGDAGAGVMVLDEGNMEDPNDDRCRAFSAINSNVPSNATNCLVADLDGDVWVGTEEGVVIFECGGSVFDNPDCIGTLRRVEQDGFGALLLETEDVLSIAVDGANRKWVGTRNGVFVLSPNGEEQVDRFTEENSPLLDNIIRTISINDQTGEVFIGTNEGIISYQSDAVAGGRVHQSEVLVYPNPVRPDYNGPIAIKGLARDAIVKITDINGQLIYETTALGGQAVWDGLDYNGRRANSGVYLVFSSSNARNIGFNAKADSAIAKIVFIN